MTFTLRPDAGRIFRYVLLALAVVLALHAVAVVLGYRLHGNPYAYRFLHLDREASVGTWFAQTILLLVAALLALIGVAARKTGQRWATHWIVLSLVALYASIDEGSALHEKTTTWMRQLTGLSRGYFGPTWVFAGMAVALVLFLVYFRFLVNLPRRTSLLLLTGAAVAISGAVALEMIDVNYSRRGVRTYGYQALAATEEGLEKLGVCIVIFALLDYIRRYVPPFLVTWGAAPRAAADGEASAAPRRDPPPGSRATRPAGSHVRTAVERPPASREG